MDDEHVIEHDPDEGCASCPLLCGERHTWFGKGVCVVGPPDVDQSPDGSPPRYHEPAPEWCPLRTGPVVVRAPGKGTP